MTDIKKSSHEWFKDPRFEQIVIMDPDGWDRWNYEASMAEPITEAEFRNRVRRSTQMFVKGLDI
jgi:hypothetical protein